MTLSREEAHMAKSYEGRLRDVMEQTRRHISQLEHELMRAKIRAEALSEALRLYERTQAVAESGGRIGRVLQLIEDAGSDGLTFAQIREALNGEVTEANEKSLRQQLYIRRKKGALALIQGRYVMVHESEEEAPDEYHGSPAGFREPAGELGGGTLPLTPNPET